MARWRSIHGANWLGRIELHPTPKLDLYAYVGGEYAGRAAYTGYQSVKVTNTPAIPVAERWASSHAPEAEFSQLSGADHNHHHTEWDRRVRLTVRQQHGLLDRGAAERNGRTQAVQARARVTPATSAESTIGFWNKIYQGEKGRVQWGMQYSYFYKTAWSGSGGLTTQRRASHHTQWTTWCGRRSATTCHKQLQTT